MADFLTYKGKPLVRKGKELYYGDMSEPYVVMLNILESKKQGDIETATKVSVQLLATDPTVSPAERVVKKSEKDGLYSAMDSGAVWLERQLKNSK